MNKIIVLGNYKPSRYCTGKIHDVRGISSTVMENHGAVIVIVIMEVEKYEDKILLEREGDKTTADV